MTEIKFGEIYLAKLVGDGHEQRGTRAVIIAQNDMGNRYSPTVEIIPLSARINKARHLPTHVFIKADATTGLRTDSLALAEQPKTIDKTKLIHRIGQLSYETLCAIGNARRIQSPFPIA
jgi:mRNA interferase MazF